MDLDETVRPWLVACGSHFGAREAYRYRRPDASTLMERPYFTYRLHNYTEDNIGKSFSSERVTQDGYDVFERSLQPWEKSVLIDLYDHEFGDDALAACCIAAQKDTDIRNALKIKNAEFKNCVAITDESTTDAVRAYYHHQMICVFKTTAYFNHLKTNHRIEDVNIDDAFSIDE